MRILVNRFADDKPSAREIIFGYTTFWFASEVVVAFKYLGTMYSKYPENGYATQVQRHLPRGSMNNEWSKAMTALIPLYRGIDKYAPKVVYYAGKGANAFCVDFGEAKVYFSYDNMIGFDVYDKSYVLDTHLTPPMRRHLQIINNPARGVIAVNQTELMNQFDRYFHQFESSISCL